MSRVPRALWAGAGALRSAAAGSAPALRHARGFRTPKPCFAPLSLQSAAVSIPHPEKVATGGEDAHFLLEPSERPNFSAIAVADGVGGWAELGINAGVYSAKLMEQAKRRLLSAPVPCPSDALAFAHITTKELGSCTACIALLDESDKLKTINLGDSGFLIVRPKAADDPHLKVLFKSPFQQHDFNTPRQLSTNSTDHPYHGDTESFAVQPGDIVLLGTDGLWDNVYDADIIDSLNKGGSPEEMAQRLGKLTVQMASHPTRNTPFSDRGEQYGLKMPGGKVDDITIVIAVVRE